MERLWGYSGALLGDDAPDGDGAARQLDHWPGGQGGVKQVLSEKVRTFFPLTSCFVLTLV